MGNTQVENHQNLVLISASEDGHPRVDVLDGVSGKSFEKALRARLGCLDGIKDDSFPLENQPRGNGLYADNVFLRGTFLLSNGEDVKTRFEVTEGMVQSAIDGVRNDFVSDKGYLNNATFRSGLEMWDSENETVFFLVGNRWVWANDNVLSKKGDGASVVTDMGRTVVRIKNKYILQKHGNLRYVPSFASVNDGKKEALPVYLSFFYRCAKAGTLKVSFEGVDKDGFENFNSMDVTEALGVTEGYVQYTCNGLWNGTGDFKLEYDGEIYLYMLVLSTDKVESLTYKYKTLFEQSNKLVKIAAMNFDKDGNVLEGSEIITTSKYNALMSERFDENGALKNAAGLITASDWDVWLKTYIGDMAKKLDIKAFAGMFASAVDNDTDIVKKADISAFITKDENGNIESGVHIGADNISLEGIVTANENFKILEDGSIETKNAKIKGYVYSVFKQIDLSDATPLGYNAETSNYEFKLNENLYVDASFSGVVLPVSEDYEGARVLIMDSHFVKTRMATSPTTIRTADGSPILSGLFRQKNEIGSEKRWDIWDANILRIDSGAIELVLKNNAEYDAATGKIVSYRLSWILINSSCQELSWETDGKWYNYQYNT